LLGEAKDFGLVCSICCQTLNVESDDVFEGHIFQHEVWPKRILFGLSKRRLIFSSFGIMSLNIVEVNNDTVFLTEEITLQRVLASLNQVLNDGQSTEVKLL